MNKDLFYSTLRFIFVIAITIIGFYVIVVSAKLTYPFIIGIILAYIMRPLVKFFNKKLNLPKGFATLFSIIIVFGILGVIFTIVISELVAGLNFLLNFVPDRFAHLILYFQDFLTNTIIPAYESITNKFNKLDPNSQETIITTVKNFSNTLIIQGQDIIRGILNGLTSFISSIPEILTTLIITLLATFFISKDWDKLKDMFSSILPNKAKGGINALGVSLQGALIGFLKAQITLISYTGLIVLVGLLILRVPYAVALAFIIGLVDLIPYVGTGTIFVPWITYVFITGNTTLGIGLTILFLVEIIQRQMMEPKVLSSNIGLDPLATLFSIYIGFQLFGFFGLVAGPISLVLINALYQTGILSDLWKFIKWHKEA